MKIQQKPLPTAENFSVDYDFFEKWDSGINWDNIYKFANDFKNVYLERVKYEYANYQFFLEGYKNGSASISEVKAAHAEFLKTLEL